MKKRILLIDDSEQDRDILIGLLTPKKGPPWIRDAEITGIDKPPANPAEYNHFSAIMLDYYLNGLSGPTGLDAAKTIRSRGIGSYILLMTEVDFDSLPIESHDYVDAICAKPTSQFQTRANDVFGCTRAMMRIIAEYPKAPKL